eukprot:TRINITY_DN95570_c0_g1_i1.p1 TRINITY_DN95570_c0_g1~~TRINITY_DN95570_c0_g1_i1.p1  ORF type:complete len:396 (-),score=124.05 TRINITY_DN95570_c0_g1_i1:55-1221(-)
METNGVEQQQDGIEVGSEPVVSKEEFLKDFFKTFKAEEQSIKEQLTAVASSGAGDKVHEALDALLMREQSLEATFTRQAHLLPPYDVQQYRAALKAIAADIASKREQLAPRKKFSFKRRAAPPSAATAGGAVEAAEAAVSGSGYSTGSRPPAEAAPSSVTAAAPFQGELFEGLRASLVTRGPGELQGRDVSLRDLEGCRVILLDRIGALHVRNLRRCEILVGAVSSSALMHHCHECVFTLAVKQLRLHDSESVALHLHTLSGPVIEHCRRIAFSPLDFKWPGGEEQLASASLGEASAEAGPWSDVQDFNWLKRQASPNWCQVPAGLRRSPLTFNSADEVLESLGKEQLPPPLPEMEKYRSCWEAAEAPQQAPEAKAAPEAPGAHDDEF